MISVSDLAVSDVEGVSDVVLEKCSPSGKRVNPPGPQGTTHEMKKPADGLPWAGSILGRVQTANRCKPSVLQSDVGSECRSAPALRFSGGRTRRNRVGPSRVNSVQKIARILRPAGVFVVAGDSLMPSDAIWLRADFIKTR